MEELTNYSGCPMHLYHTLQMRKNSKITESQMMNDKIQPNLVALENRFSAEVTA